MNTTFPQILRSRWSIYALIIAHIIFLIRRIIWTYGHNIIHVFNHHLIVDDQLLRREALIILAEFFILVGLIRRKRLAFVCSLFYSFSVCWISLVSGHRYLFVWSLVFVVLLLINQQFFFSVYTIRTSRLQIMTPLLVFVFVLGYYIFGFYLFPNGFSGPIHLQTIIQSYIFSITGIGTEPLEPITRATSLYLESLAYVGWGSLVYFIYNLFTNSRLHISMKPPPSISLKRTLSKNDPLAAFKCNPALKNFQNMLVFSPQKEVFIALGDPLVKTKQKIQTSLREFSQFAHQYGHQISLFQVGSLTAIQAEQLGLTSLFIGSEALVNLKNFTLRDHQHKNIRYAANKLPRDGIELKFLSFQSLKMEDLENCNNLIKPWLSDQDEQPTSFNMAHFPFNLSLPGMIVLAHSATEGFVGLLTFLPYNTSKKCYSLDLMIRNSKAPAGLIDGMIAKSLEYFKETGTKQISLGLAPLWSPQDNTNKSFYRSFQHLLLGQTTSYDFKGLYKFKQKFSPIWEPRYLVIENIENLPATLFDLKKAMFKK